VCAAAAVFPAEQNSRARFEAYADAIRGCAAEMRSTMQSFAMPEEYASRIETDVHVLALPVEAFGLRTITRTASGDASYFNYQDIVLRRGRMIAGFSVHGSGSGPDQVDVASLSRLVSERVERAAKSLGHSGIRIPVFSPEPLASAAAAAALTSIDDYPKRWRDQRFAEFGYDSGTAVLPGSLLLVLDDLRPEPGMIGRAAIPSLHVGWSHYTRHYAAVYKTETRAKRAARDAFERSQTYAAASARRRRLKVVATNVDAPNLGPDVHARFRIKKVRWQAGTHHPAFDVESTDTLAVIRCGRMVATYACTAKGEDVKTAHELLGMIVRKLRRAERRV